MRSAHSAASSATRTMCSRRSRLTAAHAGSVGRSPGGAGRCAATGTASAFGTERRAHDAIPLVDEDHAWHVARGLGLVVHAVADDDDQVARLPPPRGGTAQ